MPWLSTGSLGTEDFFIWYNLLLSKAVVGEYASDQGFLLPNPVSIHREYLRLRFEIEWCMQHFTKNEYT